MSASSSSFLIKKQSNEMKIVLTKDNRHFPTMNKAPSEPSANRTPSNNSVPKSVIKIAPAKKDLDTYDKPIEIPTVPKLLSIIQGQSTLSQFFNLPPTTITKEPTIAKAPTHAKTSSPQHTHLTATSHINPGVSYKHLTSPAKTTALKSQSHKNKSSVESSVEGQLERRQLTGECSEHEQVPRSKKPKLSAGTSLPLSRVKTIMKTDVQSSQNAVNIGQDSVAVIAKAGELFIAELVKRSQQPAFAQNLRTINYNHLAKAVQGSKDLHFLHAVVPRKVLARDILSPPSSDDP